MKKLLITSICVLAAGLLSAADQTAGGAANQKSQLTPEQKQERKALIEKYDLNKDGKLDKDELAKMSQDDKDKWQSLKPKKQGQQGSKSGKSNKKSQ
ncbi:MAG: hypothetical protein ACP5T0_13505 [Verrucomicrobiia bacterium]